MSHSHLLPLGLGRVRALIFVVMPWLVFAERAQSAQSAPSSVTETRTDTPIDRDRGLIRNAAELHLSVTQVGSLWTRLGVEYQNQAMFTESESAYSRGLAMLEHEPDARATYALTLGNLGSLFMLTHRLDAAERCRRRSLEIYESLGDTAAIARAQGFLGGVYLAMGRNKDAASLAAKAIEHIAANDGAMAEARAAAMLTYAYASCMSKHCANGLRVAGEAVSFIKAQSPISSLSLGQAHVALGYAEQHTGDAQKAGEDIREGVRILNDLLPPSHPLLLGALETYRQYLTENHRESEAAEVAARQRRTEAGGTCSHCTVSVEGLR